MCSASRCSIRACEDISSCEHNILNIISISRSQWLKWDLTGGGALKFGVAAQ